MSCDQDVNLEMLEVIDELRHSNINWRISFIFDVNHECLNIFMKELLQFFYL